MTKRENEIRDQIIQDNRPWGNFKRFILDQKCTVKILTVDANQKLSEQSHEKRDELWIILDKGLEVELDGKKMRPKPGQEIVILKNVKHRLSSRRSWQKGRVLEISLGHFDENDVIRYNDKYGRK